MKALISPQEIIYDENGTVLGQRVAQVEIEPFEVAEPLFWVDCLDNCTPNKSYYTNGNIVEILPYEAETPDDMQFDDTDTLEL